MRRLLLRLVAVAIVALGVPLVWFAPAGAEAPEEKGWWFKGNVGDPTGVLQGAGVKLVPPNVPDDGLYVANDPTGAAGMSALRFYLADAPGATITLKVDSSATAREFAVVACPAASGWIGDQGGAWDRRPQPDCEKGSVPGDAAEDGSTMTWELPESFAKGGSYDVVLLPDPTTAEVFQIPFQPPDESSVAAGGGGGAPSTSPAPVETEFSAEDFGTTSAGDAFSAPSSDVAAPSAGPSTADQPNQQQAAPAVPQRQVPLADKGVSATDTERWAATGVLVALGVGLWLMSGRQVPAPRLLGGLASASVATAESARREAKRLTRPVVGGIGRFKGPRTVPPTRI
jgi:hypothetical protein